MKNLTIYGLTESIAALEAQGLSKVFDSYSDFCSGEEIMQIGFNSFTGYIFIALDNGIQIGSCLGQDVVYIVTDTMNGDEEFFDTYQEALNYNKYADDYE